MVIVEHALLFITMFALDHAKSVEKIKKEILYKVLVYITLTCSETKDNIASTVDNC